MPAPIDNEHAKKYNPEKEIRDILKELEDNPEYLTIGKILEKKPYTGDRILRWCEKSNVVKESYKKAKEICKNRLIEKGLYKKTSEGITKFVLINNHGMKEKSEVDQNTNITANIEPIKIEFVDKK